MSDFYQEMQDVATDVLTEFDQGVTLVQVTKGAGPSYDPGADSEVDVVIPGTASGVSKKYVNGDSILESDLQAVIAASVAVPTMNDKLKINSDTKKIISIKAVPAAGIPAVYVVIFR